jgi:hypothetical protein
MLSLSKHKTKKGYRYYQACLPVGRAKKKPVQMNRFFFASRSFGIAYFFARFAFKFQKQLLLCQQNLISPK